MSNLKGSRWIPLGSKEAANLLSQSGLCLIRNNASTCTTGVSTEDQTLTSGSMREPPSNQPQRDGELFCQSCRVVLGDREEQVVHYRLDWHRYNLKRRLKGLVSLSQEEFERIAGENLKL